MPFLLLTATLAFLFGDAIRACAADRARSVTPEGAAGLFAVSIYGGYFNGGLGIVLLALFALWGMTDIHRMNGLKTGLSFVLSAISVAIFAAAGLVAWKQAILMMLAATVGGYAGAPIARTLPQRVVRALIAVIGFGMSGIFFWRLLADKGARQERPLPFAQPDRSIPVGAPGRRSPFLLLRRPPSETSSLLDLDLDHLAGGR